MVKFLITETSCNSSILDGYGNSALHIAYSNKYLAIVEFLIGEAKCNPDITNEEGYTVLYLACEKGDLGLVKILTTNGRSNISFINSNGKTALHACDKYQVHIIEYLINEARGDPNLTTREGNTALHLACEKGALNVVKVLTSNAKVNVNVTNINGETALHAACKNNHLSVVKHLITEAKCDPNLTTKNGDTALHLACSRAGADLAVVQFLINEAKCNSDLTNKFGNSALHAAVYKNHLNVVICLINNTKNDLVCLMNKEGYTGLHIACKCGYLQIAQFLLEAGCDPNTENKSGTTAIMLTSDPEITRELVRHGANPNNAYKTYSKQLGVKQPILPPVKVFVVGNPSAGKSTLIAALQKEISFIQRAISTGRKVSGVDKSTAGIIPHEFESKSYGRVTFYDFAGQTEFYSSHAALLQNAVQTSPPIFLLVVDLCKSNEEIKHTILYWLSFLKNQVTLVYTKPHIIVVGSHADILKSQGKELKQKVQIIQPLLNQTSDLFDFNGFVAVDCQYCESKGLTELRQFLRKSCDDLRIQKTINFSTHLFFVYLIDNFKDSAAFQLSQIQTKIMKNQHSITEIDTLYFLPDSLQNLCSICEELNDRGHILYLKNSITVESSWVIIDKQALLAQVTGTIFAPDGFKEHCQLSTSTGVVPLSKITEQFPNHNSQMLVSFLSHMELCNEICDKEILEMISKPTQTQSMEVTGSDRYFFFPGLITLTVPSRVWESKSECKYHCGWILRCSKMEDFFTTQFLQVLLLRLAFCFAFPHRVQLYSAEHPAIQRKCSIWKNGIYWGNRDGIETLVEVTDQNKTVITQMRSQEMTFASLQLRSNIIQKVLEVCKHFCGNMDTVEYFVDPFEVARYPMIPTSVLALYDLKEVAECVVRGKLSVISANGHPVSLASLISFEPYVELGGFLLYELLHEENLEKKITNRFISQMVNQTSNCKDIFVALFKPQQVQTLSTAHIANSQDETEEYFSAFHMWRDSSDGTYKSLRDKINQISIFAGRNPLELAGVSSQDQALIKAVEYANPTGLQSSSELSLSDLRDVRVACWATRVQWYSIGLELGIDPSALDAIKEDNHHSVENCFTATLKEWLKTKPNPSWGDLVKALRSPTVNFDHIAEEMYTKYVNTSPQNTDPN